MPVATAALALALLTGAIGILFTADKPRDFCTLELTVDALATAYLLGLAPRPHRTWWRRLCANREPSSGDGIDKHGYLATDPAGLRYEIAHQVCLLMPSQHHRVVLSNSSYRLGAPDGAE